MNRDPIIRCSFETENAPNIAQRFDDMLSERIMSFSYTDKSNGADEGSLKFLNNDLALFDDPRLVLGNTIYVEWGYSSQMHPARGILIKKYKGFREITISGPVKTAASFLGRQKIKSWGDVTEFEVAEEIAISLGFSLPESRSIEQTHQAIRRRSIVQSGETDWAFLQRLARNVGCIVYLHGGVFHFHEPRLGSTPVVTLKYFNGDEGQFIGDPDIEESTLGRSARVTRRGHDPNERATVEGTASNSDDPGRTTLGEVCETPEYTWSESSWMSILTDDERAELAEERPFPVERAQESVGPTTAETNDEAASRARSQFRAGQREVVKMSANIIGDPSIHADMVVRIAGMAAKFNGNYYVDEAVHSIDSSGYTSKLKLKRDAVSRSGYRPRTAVDTEGQTNDAEPSDTGVVATRHENATTGEIEWTYANSAGDPVSMTPQNWEW